jgi:predicted exporter
LLDQDRVLRADLKAPEVGHLIVIHAVDAETALRRSERVVEYLQSAVEQDTLSGFDAPSLYLPSRQTQRRRQMELPEPQRLRADLDKALTGLPFRSGLFEPFLKDVARMRTEALLRPQDLNGTALGLRLESLLFPSDRGWTALVPLTGIRNPQQLATGLARQDEENIYYLDMRAETNRLVAAFRDAALLRLGWGAILLVLVLWLALRAWQRMLAVLVPVCLAVIADISLLLWLGEKLSLFHLISLLLVVGIGIDYGLFFSRSETDVANRQRTLHSLFICSSSTIVVFGMLSLSTLPVLNAIGQTVAIGVFASFLFAFTVAQQVSKRTS